MRSFLKTLAKWESSKTNRQIIFFESTATTNRNDGASLHDYQLSVSYEKSADLLHNLVIAHAAVSGGMIVTFSHHFVRRLVEEGVKLHFFASHRPIYGSSPPIADLERIGGRYHGLPLPEHFAPLNEIWSLALMTVTLKRLQVQILHTRSSIMGAIGRIAAKLAGVPVIIHHQDDLFCRDTRLSPRTKQIIAFIERQLSRLADRSLFISEAVLKDAIAIGFDKERCVLVGMDLDELFENAANELEGTKEPVISYLRDLGVPKNSWIVGCVGRLVQHKGIDLFLEAAQRLVPIFPDWVFVIKGDRPLYQSLKTAIQNNGISTKVFLFPDKLPAKDLPALYRCFDIFALPTRREGFGMVFAEAMALGVPVVGPRIAPITEVVPETCGVLVEPENVTALVEALSELMTDSNLRDRLAKKGREHTLSTWCGRQASERVVGVYRELLMLRQLTKRIS